MVVENTSSENPNMDGKKNRNNILSVLEESNKLYNSCYNSPYFSGYSVHKSQYKRNKLRKHSHDNNAKSSAKSTNYRYRRLHLQNSPGETGEPQLILPKYVPPPTSNDKDETYMKHKKDVVKTVEINRSVSSLSELIQLCDDYPDIENTLYNINMKALHNIKDSLVVLNNMVGLQEIKSSLVDQIVYYIQELHLVTSSQQPNDFMHTVIYGPPGTGKTEIAKAIGTIFSKIGVLPKNVFKKVTRDDLIAGYLGQTAIKTKDIIKECIGGVLFIDEVYSLGNAEKRDSFSKECIDTLCEALSCHKGELMCIIAGYKDEIKNCFFKINDGLESRFPWQYTVGSYSPEELLEIFQRKVTEIGWSLNHDIDSRWFKDNVDCFKYFGRDMETLLSKVKIAHSKRVFCLPQNEKTVITEEDINKGFQGFLKSENVKYRNEKVNITRNIHNSMYV